MKQGVRVNADELGINFDNSVTCLPQVIVSGSSELQQQNANIQYVQHLPEQHTPTSIINAIQGIDTHTSKDQQGAIINAIQGIEPHTTAIQTLNPNDGTTTIQVRLFMYRQAWKNKQRCYRMFFGAYFRFSLILGTKCEFRS